MSFEIVPRLVLEPVRPLFLTLHLGGDYDDTLGDRVLIKRHWTLDLRKQLNIQKEDFEVINFRQGSIKVDTVTHSLYIINEILSSPENLKLVNKYPLKCIEIPKYTLQAAKLTHSKLLDHKLLSIDESNQLLLENEELKSQIPQQSWSQLFSTTLSIKPSDSKVENTHQIIASINNEPEDESDEEPIVVTTERHFDAANVTPHEFIYDALFGS